MTDQIQAPRIAPLEPPYSHHVEEMLRKWMPPDTGLEPLALFRTLVVHEALAARMRPLGAGILGHGLLEPRDRELMITAHARAAAPSTNGECTPRSSAKRSG
jgi:4-carboxymuconolactone decarboxylase